MLISYYIMVSSKMAAKMATVTLQLAHLLNYLFQISREGVYHWVFWRHIYLYQFVVFNCDLQLYRVALEVQWTYPERFSNVILRLGGMHSPMSFIGSIGTLMADTGLSDIVSSVFGGVSKMLTGKRFSQNVRALRMVAEEARCGIIQDKPLHCSGDLMQVLETEASKSQITKLWVVVLIKPVLLTMMFVQAERKGDWQPTSKCYHTSLLRGM